MLIRAADAVVRVLLSPTCAACGTVLVHPLESPVCPGCWRAIRALSPPWCERCGDPLSAWRPMAGLCARCRRRPPQFSIGRSAGRYEGSLREILHAFKYQGRRALAAPLAALMRAAGTDVLAGADAVVPVPLHPWRAWERGFNQADDLAIELGLPVWRALHRVRHGPQQAGLPAARRHANVRGAFAATPRVWLAVIRPASRRRLRGRIVVLVDDVMTTGATLDACSAALRAAGAAEVRALTVARAVATPPAQPRPPHRPSIARHR